MFPPNHKSVQSICVCYGATPADPAEAVSNWEVAKDVGSTLEGLGWRVSILGLSSEDTRKVSAPLVFNLCDGDVRNRFGMVSFAEELESLGMRFTGSPKVILEKCQEKTLSWLGSVRTPRWWDSPPVIDKYIAKPRFAHGSLLITEKNINGVGFPPEDYFFQEFLDGWEFTVCFLGESFLGQSCVRRSGIITRDDKWDLIRLKGRKPRVWDHSGSDFPQVREVAMRAWREMLSLSERSHFAYGRVDIRMNAQGEVYVIDMNPNAYLGKDGLVCSCWSSQGGNFGELISHLVGEL